MRVSTIVSEKWKCAKQFYEPLSLKSHASAGSLFMKAKLFGQLVLSETDFAEKFDKNDLVCWEQPVPGLQGRKCITGHSIPANQWSDVFSDGNYFAS